MIEMLQKIPACFDPSETVYAEPDIRAHATEVVTFPNGLLAVHVRDGLHISFALFEFATEFDGMCQYKVIFHGSGTGDPLREMRHSFWGEADNSGYIFYADRKLITGALDALGKWFR